MAQHHVLKCWPEPFAAVLDGSKRFEYRLDDRGFRVGDTLCLREYVPQDVDGPHGFTGREITASITYILDDGFGLPRGYCILSLVPMTMPPRADASGNVSVDDIDVRIIPATGLCVIWSKQHDIYNRPSHERITIPVERIPDLIAKLWAAGASA